MSKLNKKRETYAQETEEEEDFTGLIAVEAGSDEEFDDGNYYYLSTLFEISWYIRIQKNQSLSLKDVTLLKPEMRTRVINLRGHIIFGVFPKRSGPM